MNMLSNPYGALSTAQGVCNGRSAMSVILELKRMVKFIFALLVTTLLVACGGGVGGVVADTPSTSMPTNAAPVARASGPSSSTLGLAVALDGSASSDPEGSALTYSWTLAVPSGSVVSLSDAKVAKPTFTPDLAGTYVATLIVNDGSKDSTAALVSVSVAAASPSGDQTTNAAPVARATGPAVTPTLGTTVTLDGSASFDPEGSALTFTWALTPPPGSAAALTGSKTPKPIFTPDIAGSYVAFLAVNDGAKDSTPVTVTVTVGAASVSPQIQLDKTEPLSDTVKLSLSGTVGGSVTWYVDLKLVGSGNSADNYSVSWATAGVANGSHQILARIQTGAGTYQELQRAVTVSNSTVILSATVSGTTGLINIDARASSTYGITSVTGALDGKVLSTLTAPNACSRYCSGNSDVYRFTVDAAVAGSGAHSMVVTASDANATSKSVTLSVPISNAPVLTVTSPSDGALIYGTLRLAGTTSSDKTGAVTTTATLGDVPVLSTQSASFDTTYSVSGVTPGTYTLTVKSTDTSGLTTQVVRSVTITSTAPLGYTPVFTLPTGSSILAVEGSKILYSLSDGGVVLRDVISATQVALASAATMQYSTDWQISGGRVYVQAKDTDCTPTFVCIYEWSVSGVRRNLSTSSPYTAGSSYQENPVARDGNVIWTNSNGANPGSYTLYNASTQTYTKIAQPSTINYVGNTDYDFAVSGGAVDFWYWGQTGGSGTSSTFDIFNWNSSTSTSTRITSSAGRNIYPQVDGTRVAWQQTPVGGSADGTFTLVGQSLPTGSTATLATQVTSFKAKDGVTAWLSTGTGGSKSLKALSAAGTVTLSSLSTATLSAVGSGYVIFGEGGKIYSWSSAANTRTLLVETAPGQIFVSSGAVIFTLNSSVYRVTLN